MDFHNESIVSGRRKLRKRAVRSVMGFPNGICLSLVACVNFTGDPARWALPPKPSEILWPSSRKSYEDGFRGHRGEWLTSSEFREEMRLDNLPMPPEWQGFLDP